MAMRRRKRRGSLALEAAIAVPGFVLVAATMLYGILSVSADLLVDAALERTGRATSLAVVAADFVGVDRIGDGIGRRFEDWLASAGIPDGTLRLDGCQDLVFSIATGAVLPWLFDREFDAGDAAPELAGRLIAGEGAARWRTTCESRLSEGLLRITVRYAMLTPFGPVERRRRQSVALWASGDGTRDAREAENVWSLGNLARGRAIRIRFGGNLPIGYPVLAGFRNGIATAIHSMDLSPFGWQDVVEAQEELDAWLSDLAGFDGTSFPWGADGIDIPPGSIQSRRLLLVVPSNTDDARFGGLLAGGARDAQVSGISLTIVRYQERLPPVAVE
jgi:hypothetical protein